MRAPAALNRESSKDVVLFSLLAAIFDDTIIIRWISSGGYFVLFGLLFACGLGLPLPEDIPLLAAGAMIATGKFHVAIAAVCAWCGIIGGDCVLYFLGRKFGMEITRVPVIGSHLSRDRIAQVEKMFEKWGILVVAVGRMFAGIRGAMVVVAGTTRFHFVKFIIADGLAAVVSGGLFLFLGYWFGNKIRDPAFQQQVHKWKTWILIGAIGLIIVGVVIFWLRSRRRAGNERNEVERSPAEAVVEPTGE